MRLVVEAQIYLPRAELVLDLAAGEEKGKKEKEEEDPPPAPRLSPGPSL
jgi:hypothetical protein